MAKFAANTDVSVDTSMAEIRRTVARYGADKFAQFEEHTRAGIGFEMKGRQIRFVVNLPPRNAREFTHTPGRNLPRTLADAAKAWEQGCRQKWRALALAIKSKLECVESGIETFEQAFMAEIVLPNGKTIGEHYLPQLPNVFASGNVPPLMLPAPQS